MSQYIKNKLEYRIARCKWQVKLANQIKPSHKRIVLGKFIQECISSILRQLPAAEHNEDNII